MKENKTLIFPKRRLNENIVTYMLTKKTFGNLDLNLLQNEDKKKLEKLIPYPIAWMNQVHGANIQKIENPSCQTFKATDGIYTQLCNQVLAIKTADCIPLVLASSNGQEIAALHVGWRGMSKGIIEKSLEIFSSNSRSLTAWLGPSISVDNYEVGEEVYKAFERNPDSKASFVKKKFKGIIYVNLEAEAKRRLINYGVEIITGNYCTYTDTQIFYSFRRNGSKKRMITVVWRKNEE